jgi:PST family polysaccharide transporter
MKTQGTHLNYGLAERPKILRLAAGLKEKIPGARFLPNIGWLSVDQAIRMSLGVVITSWTARYLGPSNFGMLNYATAFVALFGFLSGLGLDGIAIRDLVRTPSQANVTLGTILVLKFIGSLIVVVLCAFIIRRLEPGNITLSNIVTIASVGGVVSTLGVFNLYFQANEIQKFTVLATNAAFLVFVVVRIVIIHQRLSVEWFAWAQTAQAALTGALLVFVYRSYTAALSSIKASLSCALLLAREAWPQMLASLSIGIYMKIDQVMIAKIAGPEANGIYSAALRISEIWYVIPTIIVPVVFPSIIRSRINSPDVSERQMLKLFSLMAAIAVLIALPVSLTSSYIIELVYGPQYRSAGPILAVHVWASLFVFWGMAQEPWNVSEGLLKLSLLRTILGAGVNVGLNLILIPRYAGIGAAFATLIAYSCATVLGNMLHRKTFIMFKLQVRSLMFVRGIAAK